ncbi:hypothetical protein L6164_018750 [Bauhinia variegata]|uniref:Uncharacterized protein n=1 Tax=Bauhinia variegata TaxID=167791 RepID=A0ACB9NDK2_BAUVA|nr:hypothetical protein L6164_018750 [Bauhinia variegata]
MVKFFSELPVDDPHEDSKLNNSKDSHETIETQVNDFSLADSFFDFDSIEDYFEDKLTADMAAQENSNVEVEDKSNKIVKDECSEETTVLDQQMLTGSESIFGFTSCHKESESVGSTSLVKIEAGESEKLGTSSCTIEDGLGKISLVGSSQRSVIIDRKSEILIDEHENESSESESADPSSPSSSSSHHTDSDSGSTSSDDTEDDKDDNEEEEKGKENTEHNDVEIEEGEIRDFAGENLVTETTTASTDEEDVEKMVSWSGINDDDVDDFDDEDEDGSRHATKGPIRSKNELEVLPPVPSVDITLQPHHQMLAVGVVMSILGAQVIVEGVEKHDPLNEGSILWITESRRPLGLVDEIFGPVKNPYYVVRYNSENEIPEGIHVGSKISFVPEFADHVLNNKDLYKKGYDASGANDEEMTDEEMFSDDEKEAELARSLRMTKRGINDQNPRKMRNNRKKVPQKEGVVPTYPVGPAATSSGHGNCSTFLGTGQGTLVPPFQPATAGLNPLTNGIWTNWTFPQPQSSMFPNALTSMFLQENTQNSYQLPVPGIPFQQQVNLAQASLPTTILPGMQPNIYRQPMFPPGLVNQNQMTFGLSPHPAQMQPPLCAEQGFLSNEWLERNNNPQMQPPPHMHSGTNPACPCAPHQFRRGKPTNRGRKAFHRGGRKGWRPA